MGHGLEVPSSPKWRKRKRGPLDPSICPSEPSCELGPGLGTYTHSLIHAAEARLGGKSFPFTSETAEAGDVSEDLQAPGVVGPSEAHWGCRRKKEAAPFLRILFRGKMCVLQISRCPGRWGGSGLPLPHPAAGLVGQRSTGCPQGQRLQLCSEGTHGGGAGPRPSAGFLAQRASRSTSVHVEGVLTSVGGSPPPTADMPTACGQPGALPSSLQPQPMAPDTDTGLGRLTGASRLLKSRVHSSPSRAFLTLKSYAYFTGSDCFLFINPLLGFPAPGSGVQPPSLWEKTAQW